MSIDLNRTKRIFQKLMRIAPRLADIKNGAKSEVHGNMDLRCEILETGSDFRRIALGHYWEHPSGYIIPDPDIELSVFLDWELAEAITYRDAFKYEDAYPVMGEPPDLEVHPRINTFLDAWLGNLIAQDHLLTPCQSSSAAHLQV